MNRIQARTRGFSMVEMTAALGILAAAMVMVGQVSLWCLAERKRHLARQDAQEAAVNILEAARATSWEALTPAWAKEQQRLPESMAGGKIEVRVEPETGRPQTKRVTVEVQCELDGDKQHRPARVVKLVGLFSARTAPASGGKP
jgi:type II secretory pathway pseudopilin PulG